MYHWFFQLLQLYSHQCANLYNGSQSPMDVTGSSNEKFTKPTCLNHTILSGHIMQDLWGTWAHSSILRRSDPQATVQNQYQLDISMLTHNIPGTAKLLIMPLIYDIRLYAQKDRILLFLIVSLWGKCTNLSGEICVTDLENCELLI